MSRLAMPYRPSRDKSFSRRVDRSGSARSHSAAKADARHPDSWYPNVPQTIDIQQRRIEMKKVLGLLLGLAVMVSMTVPTFGQQQNDKKTEKTEKNKKGKKDDKKATGNKDDKKEKAKKDDKKDSNTKD